MAEKLLHKCVLEMLKVQNCWTYSRFCFILSQPSLQLMRLWSLFVFFSFYAQNLPEAVKRNVLQIMLETLREFWY